MKLFMPHIIIANPRHPLAVLVLLVIAVTACPQAALGEQAEAYPYRKHLHTGEWNKAARGIKAVMSRGHADLRVEVDRSRLLRLMGKTDRARRMLEGLEPDQLDHPYAKLERALIDLAEGRAQTPPRLGRAVSALRRLEQVKNPRVVAEAKLRLAEIDFDQKRYQPCITKCDRVLKQAGNPDPYSNPDASDLRHLKREAQKLKQKATDAMVALRFGDDYAHYRRARFAQRAGRYEQAIQLYRQVEAPILADAAAFYTGPCLAKLGHDREALRHLEGFVEEDPTGLYRGEALLHLSRIQLYDAASKRDLARVHETLTQAMAWHGQIKQASPPANKATIKKILDAFPVPKNRAEADGFGNYYRKYAGPETVLNRLTSTWYLGDLELRTALLLAFVENERGEIDQAREMLDQALRINQQNGGQLLRLTDLTDRLAFEARDGAFILPRSAWRMLGQSGTAGLRTRLGYFYLAAGEYGSAKAQFNHVTNLRQGGALLKAAAQLGLAATLYETGQADQAKNILRRFDSQYRRTALAPVAWMLLGNVHAGETSGLEDAITRYQAAIRAAGRSGLADRAKLSLAVAALNHDRPKLAKEAVDAIRGQTYAAAGQTLLQGAGIAQDSTETMYTSNRIDDPTTAAGRVHTVARHLVYPGPLDLRVQLAGLKSADAVQYRIGFSMRSGCFLRGFYHRTTIFDPQAPPVDESPLTFWRVPLLVTGPLEEPE